LGRTSAIRIFLITYFRAGEMLRASHPGLQLIAGLDAVGPVGGNAATLDTAVAMLVPRPNERMARKGAVAAEMQNKMHD
jgi:hypothetical protein